MTVLTAELAALAALENPLLQPFAKPLPSFLPAAVAFGTAEFSVLTILDAVVLVARRLIQPRFHATGKAVAELDTCRNSRGCRTVKSGFKQAHCA